MSKELKLGRVGVRTGSELHAKLATAAKEEGISLNQYVLYLLTRASTARRYMKFKPKKACAPKLPRRCKCGLDLSQIDRIRSLHESGTLTTVQLAARFQVSRGHVSKIIKGKCHVG